METTCVGGVCPFSQISWLWYMVSVVAVYMVGAIWYGKLFTKQWIKAVDYKCPCGADMANGEKCTCSDNGNSTFTMVMQFVATALIGLVYFILPWMYALAVAVAMSGWMKAALKFKIPEWKRFFTLACIEVGYFFIASIMFMLFAMI